MVKTKVATRTKVIVAVIVLAGLAALGYGAAVAPRLSTTSPRISEVKVLEFGATSARIIWLTDKGAASIVSYGTTPEHGSVATGAAGTTHDVKLTDLTPGTVYHFRVHSVDRDGNRSTSSDQTFSTALSSSGSSTTTPSGSSTSTP